MCKKLSALLLAAVLLAALSAPFAAPLAAYAAEGDAAFARITREGIYLYSEPDEDAGLFELPQSWFVRVTARLGGYCAVAYLSDTPERTAVYGYCKEEELTFVGYTPETPFLSYTVDVTFSAGDPSLPDGFLTTYTVSAAYYGSFSYGSATYYYVELEGRFGYVPASACPPLDLPENTEHTETETPAPDPDGSPAGSAAGAVSVVLACVLAAAALGIAYFLFRPAARAGRRSKRAERDEREDVYF